MFSGKCGAQSLNNASHFASCVFGTVNQRLAWKHGAVCAGNRRGGVSSGGEAAVNGKGAVNPGGERNLLPTPVEKKKLGPEVGLGGH